MTVSRQNQTTFDFSSSENELPGWLRAIRGKLRLSTGDVALRLGISEPLYTAIEKAEASGRLQMQTLREVAGALDCDLVYQLRPRAATDVALSSECAAGVSSRAPAARFDFPP